MASHSLRHQKNFLAALDSAKEIHVEEYAFSIGSFTASLEKTIQDFESDRARGYRTFVVQVKSTLLPGGKQAFPIETVYNRKSLLDHARSLLIEKDYILARNLYAFLLQFNLFDWESLKGLGFCLIHLGVLSSAKKCLSFVIDHCRDDEAYVFYALCCLKEQRRDQACKYVKKVQNSSKLLLPAKQEYLSILEQLSSGSENLTFSTRGIHDGKL